MCCQLARSNWTHKTHRHIILCYTRLESPRIHHNDTHPWENKPCRCTYETISLGPTQSPCPTLDGALHMNIPSIISFGSLICNHWSREGVVWLIPCDILWTFTARTLSLVWTLSLWFIHMKGTLSYTTSLRSYLLLRRYDSYIRSTWYDTFIIDIQIHWKLS